MSNIEIKDLSERAAAMSREERMIMLESFPVEELIGVISLKYETLKSKYDHIQDIINNGL